MLGQLLQSLTMNLKVWRTLLKKSSDLQITGKAHNLVAFCEVLCPSRDKYTEIDELLPLLITYVFQDLYFSLGSQALERNNPYHLHRNFATNNISI